jgi:hypothetical protein
MAQRVHISIQSLETYVRDLPVSQAEQQEVFRERFAHAITINAYPNLKRYSVDHTARRLRRDIVFHPHTDDAKIFGAPEDRIAALCSTSCAEATLVNICREVIPFVFAYLQERRAAIEQHMDDFCDALLQNGTHVEKQKFHSFIASLVSWRSAIAETRSNRRKSIRIAKARLLLRLHEMSEIFQGRWGIFPLLSMRLNDPAVSYSKRITLWYLDCLEVPIRAYRSVNELCYLPTASSHVQNLIPDVKPKRHPERGTLLLETG